MIRVYHLSERAGRHNRADAMCGFTPDHVSLCAQMFNLGMYDHVATVDTDNLDVAYERTNTIDKYWWEHGEVTTHIDGTGCRSTSVGDVLVLQDGSAHVVSSFGFTKLNVSPVTEEQVS